MCGIAGYIGEKRFSPFQKKKLFDLMKNRGPDDSGYKNIINNNISIDFFFSRLSIIDSSKYSNQPFNFNDKTLIFNGEIYNYLEIKNELKKKGYTFKTSSDTEVLIKALDFWGINCVKKLEGMWAFFYHDNKTKISYLCRDRFGEKPLFYLKNFDEIFFGSEIKYIKCLYEKQIEINYDKLENFLRNGYKSLNKNSSTHFKKINKVPSGCYLKIKKNQIQQVKYWDISYNPVNISENECIKTLQEKLFKSIELRLRSDFPIAFFLSGGIDSNTLAFIAKKHFGYDLKTYSIVGNDKMYDESEMIKYSNKFLNADHTNLKIKLEKKNFIKTLKEQISYHDSPVTTINSHLNFLLCQKVKKDGFKVSISGIGSDEIFSGYYDHHLLYLNEIKKNRELYLTSKKNWSTIVKPMVRNPLLRNDMLYLKNPSFRTHIYQHEKFKTKLFKKNKKYNFTELKYVKPLMKNRMLNEMFNEIVPPVLKEDDMNSMFHSIENRSPFLDRQLFETALNMPSKYYIKYGLAKWPLRQIIKNYVPEKIRMNKRKIGFNASIKDIFPLNKKNVSFLLADSDIFKIVDRNNFKYFINKNKNLTGVENNFLFNFLSTKLFLEEIQK
jgi:asparagine synthase (glutamine-hydrolysing)